MRNHGSSSNSGLELHLLHLFQAKTVSVTACFTPAPSPPCWMPRASVTWREVPLLLQEWGLPAGTRSTLALQKRYRRDSDFVYVEGVVSLLLSRRQFRYLECCLSLVKCHWGPKPPSFLLCLPIWAWFGTLLQQSESAQSPQATTFETCLRGPAPVPGFPSAVTFALRSRHTLGPSHSPWACHGSFRSPAFLSCFLLSNLLLTIP